MFINQHLLKTRRVSLLNNGLRVASHHHGTAIGVIQTGSQLAPHRLFFKPLFPLFYMHFYHCWELFLARIAWSLGDSLPPPRWAALLLPPIMIVARWLVPSIARSSVLIFNTFPSPSSPLPVTSPLTIVWSITRALLADGLLISTMSSAARSHGCTWYLVAQAGCGTLLTSCDQREP